MTGEKPGVAVITGASSGIGLAAAQEFARRGWTVALVGRDPGRLKAATDLVLACGAARPFQCNFAVLDEVRALGAELAREYPSIDVLANNAGGAFARRKTTVDGFELTIQVNHLAHFLLAHLLRDRLRGGRMINTSSAAHGNGDLDPDHLNGRGQGYRTFGVYGAAKQANILFAAEAARRWPEILSTSYHPGVVRTRFGHDSVAVRLFYRFAPGLRTPEQGADTLLWLATAPPGELAPGGYYQDRRLRAPASRAADPDTAARLWAASLTAVGLTD